MESILKNEISIYEKYFKGDRELITMRETFKNSVLFSLFFFLINFKGFSLKLRLSLSVILSR